MDGRPTRARSLLALAIVVAAMAYLCLHPFRLRSPVPELSLGALAWRHLAPGDLLSNLAFFIPFGAVLAWVLPPSLRAPARLLLVACAALGLSLAFEVLQQLVPGRVSSGIDVLLNGAGAVLGAPLARWLRWPGWTPSPAARLALALVSAWLALRLFPFRPSLRWRDWWASAQEFLATDHVAWADVLLFSAAYTVLFGAVQAIGWRRLRTLLACVALVMAVLAGRLLIPALAGEAAEWCGVLVAAGLVAAGIRAQWVGALVLLAVAVDLAPVWALLATGDWQPFSTLLAVEHRSDLVRACASAGFWALALVACWWPRGAGQAPVPWWPVLGLAALRLAL